MAKDDSYTPLSYSTCFAGAVGSLLTFVVGEYPEEPLWRAIMYLIPPITLVTYTLTNFVESRIKEWWASRAEKADVDFIVKECDSILKDDAFDPDEKAAALAVRNTAKMSVLNNKVHRLKKHEVSDSDIQDQPVKRNKSATNKSGKLKGSGGDGSEG